MTAAGAIFQSNIQRTRTLCGIAEYLEKSVTFDISDIYRAVIVLTVSSLDSYVHQVVAEKIPSVLGDKSKQTDAFLRFQVPMNWVQAALSNAKDFSWSVGAVNERHSFLSFQQPDDIADALRLITGKAIWPFVSKEMKIDTGDLKQRVKLVVDRRNKIAHEADLDPLTGKTWPIDAATTTDAINLIEMVVQNIDKVLS